MRWLRETAPVKLKLAVAFSTCFLLTLASVAVGAWAIQHVTPHAAPLAPALQRARTVFSEWETAILAATALTGAIFWRIIAIPYVKIVERMERLAAGDLDGAIPFTSHTDCVGRIATAMFTFRDTAIARQKTMELNRTQSQALLSANAKLERLARHLSRALEDAKHASQAKSRFLAGMSHEMRTPLNGLLGYARLLRLDGALTPAQEDRVSAMLVAGGHLLETINRVLDISEIESERTEVKPCIAEVLPAAQACLDMVRPAAAAKDIALGITVHPETPVQLLTDATRMRQVLLNLLGNAVKFTAAGTVEMRLAPARAFDGGLRVEVADTGPGIPADQRAHLFQEFERLDTSIADRVEGAGLGLALSLRLARMLGGMIGHEDNPTGGSIFWMELPPLQAAPGGEPEEAEAVEAPARLLRVLVVDDLAMNREIARAFLCAAGHDVFCAEGGAEAVRAVAAGDFDVVVMDVRMPEMDGLEATRCIRALAPPQGDVPIVAMTAQAFAEQVRECRLAGMNGHVAKPFAPEDLTQAVAKAVSPAGRTADLPRVPIQPARPAALPAETAEPSRVLDEAIYARTAGVLPPDVLTSFLKTMAERARTLSDGIHLAATQPDAPNDLADLAHTLGGSAGMFGFRRLADVAKRYEYAVNLNAPEAPDLAAELGFAADQAMEVVGSKLHEAGRPQLRPRDHQ
jgi:signal transduction histidine kinase/ActR/RegA family two-component response regulator/HPt (histidine-containing phosphotransfer) domain-containing protein